MLEPYSEGTANVVTGSDTVTGNHTYWAQQVRTGDKISVDHDVWYIVTAVNSDTEIKIDAAYLGATAQSKAYIIARDSAQWGMNAAISADVASLMKTYKLGLQAPVDEVAALKNDAMAAKRDALTAKIAAETARTNAETAKQSAETSAERATLAQTAAEAASLMSAQGAAMPAEKVAETGIKLAMMMNSLRDETRALSAVINAAAASSAAAANKSASAEFYSTQAVEVASAAAHNANTALFASQRAGVIAQAALEGADISAQNGIRLAIAVSKARDAARKE